MILFFISHPVPVLFPNNQSSSVCPQIWSPVHQICFSQTQDLMVEFFVKEQMCLTEDHPTIGWIETTMTDHWSGFVLKYSHPSQSKQNYDYSILGCSIWCVLQTTLSDSTSRWLMWFVASWVRRWSEAGASYDGGGASALRGKLMAIVVMKRPFLENKHFLDNVFLLNFTFLSTPHLSGILSTTWMWRAPYEIN